MKPAITAHATTNDTTNPTASEPPPPASKMSRDLYASYKVAAPSVGKPSKNENSAAVRVDKPASWPPRMVHIDREAPGHMARHCMQPTTIAFGAVMSSIESA